MPRRIVVHEYILPRGPVTHKQCTIPADLLEYLLGVDLEEEQTDYYMDTEQYIMLLRMNEVRANLTLHLGGKYEKTKSKSSPS